MAAYQPERGDLILIDFDPQAGGEQRGRRPAIVMSGKNFNVATGLALVCPITNQLKGSPFEVPLPAGLGVTGAVLCSHAHSHDWLARRATFRAKAPLPVVRSIQDRLSAILLDP